MTDLTQEQKFKFRYRMEQEAEQATGQAAPMTAQESWESNPAIRVLRGVEGPAIAALKAFGPESISKQLTESEQNRESGMQKRYGDTTDWMGMAGSLVPGLAIGKGIAGALPAATGVFGRAGVGLAQGAGIGAATPLTGQSELSGEKVGQIVGSGLVGGAVPLGIDAVKGLFHLGKQAVEPIYESGRAAILKRFQEKALGNDPSRIQAVTQVAAQARPDLSGQLPTLGEATTDIPGATGLHAHQQSISKLAGISPQFTERAAAGEAAREGAIGNIARTPYALEAAVKARGAEAATKYGAAAQRHVPANDPTFLALMDRPSMAKAAGRASELAKEAGETFDPTSVKSLHYMKMAMDDLLKNPERFSIGATEAGAIAKTQKEFVKWIGTQVPEYEAARAAFQTASGPINRMQVGQQLETVLRNPLHTGERGAMFAKAVEEAPRTIKKATGQTMFDKLEDVLQPGESQAVNKVADELSRVDAFKRSAAKTSIGGSDAIPGKVGLPLPNLLSRPAMIANFVMGKFGTSAEDKIAKVAAAQYLNPKQFAASMAQVPERYRPMIEALMRQAGPAAATGTARQF